MKSCERKIQQPDHNSVPLIGQVVQECLKTDVLVLEILPRNVRQQNRAYSSTSIGFLSNVRMTVNFWKTSMAGYCGIS